MKKVFLGLGSNMGDREALLLQALKMIESELGAISSVSSLYESEALGFEGDKFLNIVVCTESSLSPSGLIGRILMIESKLGRIRCESRYTSRTIDVDILFIDNEVINNDSLTIPHPRLHLRRFVLEPLNEIAPKLVHPVIGKDINQLLEECSDTSMVNIFKSL